jgi:hypothetical protein
MLVSSPNWGPRPYYYYCQAVAIWWCVAPSLTRERIGRLQLLLFFTSAAILRSESRGTHDHIPLSQIRDSFNLEGQDPVFLSPRNRVAQLHPKALGSLFVVPYDSQGYGGAIRTRLLTECPWSCEVKITLRLVVYSQSVRLGIKPLETHNQWFFSTEHLR